MPFQSAKFKGSRMIPDIVRILLDLDTVLKEEIIF